LAETASVLARWIIGVLFIYMGMNKAADPVEFLKLVRQYDAIQSPLLLNLTASALPWFEIFCGVLLLLGVAVRGTAAVSLLLLVGFTWLVFQHPLELSRTGGQAFCAIRFNCGCGGGTVWICGKIAENSALALLSVWLIVARSTRLCLRHTLFSNP
jgi:uncharacterized membrane protein YphA (DoxX/SURF4 family)